VEAQRYTRVRHLAHATLTLMAVVSVLLAAAADFHR
jgi:hypothetical protein